MKPFTFHLLPFTLAAVLLFASCEKDPESSAPSNPEGTVSALVLNEGSWGANNAVLTAIDVEEGTVVDADWFSSKNNRGLGDVAQDILVYGSKIYATVTFSNSLEVIDVHSGAATRVDLGNRRPRYIAATDGKLYIKVDGGYWRMMVFIDNAITKQAVNPESSRAAGRAFGNFQAMLADIPVQLGETIKDFHNMEFRLQQLREVVKSDPVGRVKEERVQKMLAEIEKRAEEMCKAERMGREGTLPKRVCHCDTKVNNMMFDELDNVLCVIDLDTVMPNFIFSDYGDFLRTASNCVAEDCPDMDKVEFRMDIFKAFTEGYLESAKSFLLPVEIENLPYATALFPYMQCVRFLWDYLSGDKYWKCQYPDHNFVRANNQLHLLLSIEKHYPEMQAYIDSLL